MVNRPQKPILKAPKLNKTPRSTIKQNAKKPEKQSLWQSWLSSILVLAVLLSSIGLVMAFAWISLLFIFNPSEVIWLNRLLPKWAQIPLSRGENPQTMREIQLSLSAKKQIGGETLPLDQDDQNSFLLPVFQQRSHCQSDCQQVVELRVYQRADDLKLQAEPEAHYQLADQIFVTGLEESFVESSSQNTPENQDFNVLLPLSEVKHFEDNTQSPGTWFYLQGHRSQGTNAIAYGHVLYYNPERNNLQQMLSWTSLDGHPPKWQQVTGDGAKELVVDQSVGLEPRLQVYQVKSIKLFFKPIQLEAIDLKQPALKDSAYQNALLLARNGLWTPAFERLKFIQKQRAGVLPEAAQAQIDLIRLHSQLTKTQAEKIWISPSQQVLAYLIDGRWQKALQVFAASPHNAQEIATLLKAERGRLWKRTITALQVNPNQPEVQAWGALILAVKHGERGANSWLKTQPKISPETLAYIQGLLKKLNAQETQPQVSSTRLSQIIGSVQQVNQVISTEWLQADSTTDLQLTDNQVWYQIEVSAFHNGKSWLNSPLRNLKLPNTHQGRFLWETLGIIADPAIQIFVWLTDEEQQTITASVRGVQLRGGILYLLASGEKIPQNKYSPYRPRPLALTDAALEWVEPSPITLQELFASHPQEVRAILPKVWRSLQLSGEISSRTIPSFQEMQEQMGYWPVQVINLTNDAQPEVVFTISAAAIASLNQSASESLAAGTQQTLPRSLIFSYSGKLIYTDFKRNYPQNLLAITKLGDEQTPALLVETARTYNLKRWSEKSQRFE